MDEKLAWVLMPGEKMYMEKMDGEIERKVVNCLRFREQACKISYLPV